MSVMLGSGCENIAMTKLAFFLRKKGHDCGSLLRVAVCGRDGKKTTQHFLTRVMKFPNENLQFLVNMIKKRQEK